MFVKKKKKKNEKKKKENNLCIKPKYIMRPTLGLTIKVESGRLRVH